MNNEEMILWAFELICKNPSCYREIDVLLQEEFPAISNELAGYLAREAVDSASDAFSAEG